MPKTGSGACVENNTATSLPSHAIKKGSTNSLRHPLLCNAENPQHQAPPPLLPPPVAYSPALQAQNCHQEAWKIELEIST
ncbi:hypothetical protein L1049_004184 [Liquidambar formosana]|uniref:Uncharacterized protein n=1 Tax=Liquidambar formosana TaxID=63359 RepID=A0AAP0WVW1_LIQFO